jgi:hypothetical protein
MKYFAKWLAVEGEIKEGDFWIAKDGSYHTGATKSVLRHANLSGCKKVKLFLCSRDIQVGDIAMEEGRFIPFEYTFMMDNCIPLSPKLFKVIGEISPDARVKEGDEFDKTQLSISTRKGIMLDMPFEQPTVYQPHLDKGIFQIKIKCPWGHFH